LIHHNKYSALTQNRGGGSQQSPHPTFAKQHGALAQQQEEEALASSGAIGALLTSWRTEFSLEINGPSCDGWTGATGTGVWARAQLALTNKLPTETSNRFRITSSFRKSGGRGPHRMVEDESVILHPSGLSLG
jgi:hypothetical protein